jgi:hypothetical protein
MYRSADRVNGAPIHMIVRSEKWSKPGWTPHSRLLISSVRVAICFSHVLPLSGSALKYPAALSLVAGELRAAYETGCAVHDHKPLSMPKFAGELKALGYDKWQSCGVIRYRGLRFAA